MNMALYNNNAKTMSSLEIAELTGKNHADIIRDIRVMFQQAEIDQSRFASIYLDSYGRGQSCFKLPRRECDLLISGYSVKYRLAIIERWQELEAKEAQEFVIPKTRAEALRLAADLEEKLEVAIEQLAIAAPKVNFHDMVTEASNCHTFEEAAKIFGIGRNTLFDLLRENKIMPAKSRLPYQHYMRYFKVIETPYLAASGVTKLATKTVINGDGFAYIQKRFFQTSSKELN